MPSAIMVLFVFSLPGVLLSAETRTILESRAGVTREVLQTVTITSQGDLRMTTVQEGQTYMITKTNPLGELVFLSIQRKGSTFRAERRGAKVQVFSESARGTRLTEVDLASKPWVARMEDAGRLLIASKRNSLEVVLVNEMMPEQALAVEVSLVGKEQLDLVEALQFQVTMKGFMALMAPKTKFWTDDSGSVLAWEAPDVTPSSPPGGQADERVPGVPEVRSPVLRRILKVSP